MIYSRYTQGMSDILAPILAEVRNEADVFWCFAGLMSKTIFITSPKDEDMEKNLVSFIIYSNSNHIMVMYLFTNS